MTEPKEGTQLEPEQTQAPDWLDRLVGEIYAKPGWRKGNAPPSPSPWRDS